MSNSSMVVYTKLTPNNSGKRTHSIDRITPHCVVGQCTAEGLGDWFYKTSTQASSNYGIDKDGRVGIYVEECNRSWCTSSRENDQRAITIECASDTTEPYAMRSVVYDTLIKLCVDICKRNGKNCLIWIDNKEKALSYEPKANEMLITVHRWYANKSCPGNWLYSRLADLAQKVTEALQGGENKENVNTQPEVKTLYRVQVGAYSIKDNAENMLKKLKAAGFDGFIFEYKQEVEKKEPENTAPVVVKKTVDELAQEVIQGKWGNGSDRKNRLEAAGYNYSEVQKRVNDILK